MLQKFFKQEKSQEVLALAENNRTKTLETFEKMLQQYEGDFVASNEVTIADL